MKKFLDFEKPIVELEGKLKELEHLVDNGDSNAIKEADNIKKKIQQQLEQVYSRLSPWEKVHVARHPDRPHFSDYIENLIEDFIPLSGDRFYGDDQALIGGLGRFRGHSVVIIGHEKGSDTKSRLKHNFGMAHPEGYRKAVRLINIANRFSLPVLTFVDTSGAYPGVGAEERGQAEAIARSLEACLSLNTPLIANIVGEGGSGGAVAIAVGDRVLMMEHSIYSVISPEGCASILWRSTDKAQDAANSLKLTAIDLLNFNVIDKIIKEPLGGAHRNPLEAINSLGDAIEKELEEALSEGLEAHKLKRREKFLSIGRL